MMGGLMGDNRVVPHKLQEMPGWKCHPCLFAGTEMGNKTSSSAIFTSIAFALTALISASCNFVPSSALYIYQLQKSENAVPGAWLKPAKAVL